MRSDDRQRQAVVDYERQHGRRPKEMDFAQTGYDIQSDDPASTITRRIEVKGIQGTWSGKSSVVMSSRQFTDAQNPPLDVEYWLYVVDGTETSIPAIYPICWTRVGPLHFGFHAQHWRHLGEQQRLADSKSTAT